MKIFDSHFHIIDNNFPLVPNNGFRPDAFTCDEYLQFLVSQKSHGHEFVGGVVVSGSFQAHDQNYLLKALEVLGGQYVGVTQLDPFDETLSDEDIYALHAHGVRGVRFNLRRGGGVSGDDDVHIAAMWKLLRRVHDLVDWHAEFYVESSSLMSDSSPLFRLIMNAPKVVIDHVGIDVDDSEKGEKGFELLLQLFGARANVFVKLSGFGRLSASNDLLTRRLQSLASIGPNSLVFGTDMPGTRAREVFNSTHIGLIINALGKPLAQKIACENGRILYGLDDEFQRSFEGIDWNQKDEMIALEVQQPFSNYILEGNKSIETREYPLPRGLEGRTIVLLETPAGSLLHSSLENNFIVHNDGFARGESGGGGEDCPGIVGSVVFSRSFEYTSEAIWRNDEARHMVSSDSKYGWSAARRKFGWVVCAVNTREETLLELSKTWEEGDSHTRNFSGVDASFFSDNTTLSLAFSFNRIYRSFFQVKIGELDQKNMQILAQTESAHANVKV